MTHALTQAESQTQFSHSLIVAVCFSETSEDPQRLYTHVHGGDKAIRAMSKEKQLYSVPY